MANTYKKIVVLTVVAAMLLALGCLAVFIRPQTVVAEAFSLLWTDSATPEEDMQGDGSDETPYLITCGADMARMALWVNGGEHTDSHYCLTSDIDMDGRIMTSIGTYEHPFDGNFDGAGYTISNLGISEILDGDPTTYDSYFGLFGKVQDAQITNFGIKSGKIGINGTIGNEVQVNVGSVVGYAGGITEISSVFSFANIIVGGDAIQDGSNLGGIVGYFEVDATVTGCSYSADIELRGVSNLSINAIGGIAGLARGATANCYSNAVITADNALSVYAGGIVGREAGLLTASLSVGSAKGDYIAYGGLVGGLLSNLNVHFSYYLSDGDAATHGVAGIDDIDTDENKIKGLSGAELEASALSALHFSSDYWAKYTSLHFDGSAYYAPYLTAINAIDAKYSQVTAMLRIYGSDKDLWFDDDSEFGSEANPYLIESCEHMNTLSAMVPDYSYDGKFFKVVGNADNEMDLSGLQNPIGQKISTGGYPFNATFDGNNVVFTNLNMDKTSASDSSNIGLFGYVGASGKLVSFTLSNTCSVAGKEYVGSVVGYNAGSLQNIETQATVRGTAFVGGVVGYNYNGSLSSVLSLVKLVAATTSASNIYGVVGDAISYSGTNVWYAIPNTADYPYKTTNNRGSVINIDVTESNRRTDVNGRLVYGSGMLNVTVYKTTAGEIKLEGYVSETLSAWGVEYRYADETVIGNDNYTINAATPSRTIYARFVRTLYANSGAAVGSALYFSRTVTSAETIYETSRTFYVGQSITVYSEIPDGKYLSKLTAVAVVEGSETGITDFDFSYANSLSDARVIVTFAMTESLRRIETTFTGISAPDVAAKTYDGEATLYLASDTSTVYSHSIDGYTVEYAYNVSGGAPKDVGSYVLTVVVRSADGIRRGSQAIPYDINAKLITLSEDMLTKQKEFDGSTQYVAAAIINQSGITDIISGDTVLITAKAAYATTDIGWTYADFTFEISGASASNYIAPQDMLSVYCEITKRALTVEIKAEDLTYVYDGENAEVNYYSYAKAPIEIDGLTPVIDVYFSTDIIRTRVAARDIGVYDVNVALIDKAEYYYDGRPITYYYTVSLAEEYQFEITPLQVDIGYANYDGLVYNGAEQNIAAYFYDEDGVLHYVDTSCFTYQITAGSGDMTESNKLKFAGDYTLRVTLSETGNYKASPLTDSFGFSVAKAALADIKVATSQSTFIYGDNSVSLSVDNVPADYNGSIAYGVVNGLASVDETTGAVVFTGAGNVYFAASLSGDNNYKAKVTPNKMITVDKAELTIDVEDIVLTYGSRLSVNFVFDGFVTADIGKTAPDGFVAPTVKIYKEGVADEVVQAYKLYDAGTYELNIQENAASTSYTFNYTLLASKPSVTINEKAISIVPDNKLQVYGRADADNNPFDLPLTYTVRDENGDNLDVSLVGVNMVREEGISVANYAISVGNVSDVVDANPNYSITCETGVYSITAKTVTVTMVAQSKLYGSPDPAVAYSVSGLAAWDKESEVLTPKNVDVALITRESGENAYWAHSQEYGVYYYVRSNMLVDNNYTLNFVTNTLTIKKAVPQLESQEDMVVPYGDSIDTIAPTAIMRATDGNGNYVHINGTFRWLNGGAKPSFGGENMFAALFTPIRNYSKDSIENNCASVEINLNVGIEKRLIDFSVTKTEFVYNGKIQRLAYSLGNVVAGDELQETVDYSAEPIGANEYVVTFTVGNGNYTFEEGGDTDNTEVIMTIAKAPLTIYLKDIELGEGVTPTKDFIYEGFVNGETAKDLTKLPDVTFYTEAGNYTITPSGAASPNYNITYRSSKQSVTKTILNSDVQDLTLVGSFDYLSEIQVEEIVKSSNRALYKSYNSEFSAIRTANSLGNVTIQRIYSFKYTIDGEAAELGSNVKATMEIPKRLTEAKKFCVLFIDEDGAMTLADNVVRTGNKLSFDMRDCAYVAIVTPPDYTYIIVGVVVVFLIILVFSLDLISEKLGIGRHKNKVKKKK